MTHQNIIDLRELIRSIQDIYSSTSVEISTIRQRVMPVNHTHNSYTLSVINGFVRIETLHHNLLQSFNQLCQGFQEMEKMSYTPDSNIFAFGLYERLTAWQQKYSDTVVRPLNALKGTIN